MKLAGVITALVTPFKNGAIDEASYRKLLRSQIEQGVQGFVVNGTTAESPTLEFKEVEQLYKIAREEASGATILVGTGGNSTASTVAFTEAVQSWKTDGVLVVVPYYNRPPQRGLVAHFSAVAKASKAPVVLYNVPSRTVASLDPQSAGELSRAHSNIVAIKDATGDMNVLNNLRESCRPDFIFLSGDDGTCVEFAARGGHGLIGVASQVIGREMNEAIAKARGGDQKIAAEYKQKYSDLMKWLYVEVNPIPIKMALKMMGVIESAEMRLPLVELDSKFHKDLLACLKNLKKA